MPDLFATGRAYQHCASEAVEPLYPRDENPTLHFTSRSGWLDGARGRESRADQITSFASIDHRNAYCWGFKLGKSARDRGERFGRSLFAYASTLARGAVLESGRTTAGVL